MIVSDIGSDVQILADGQATNSTCATAMPVFYWTRNRKR
jgi:hypothetical protein